MSWSSSQNFHVKHPSSWSQLVQKWTRVPFQKLHPFVPWKISPGKKNSTTLTPFVDSLCFFWFVRIRGGEKTFSFRKQKAHRLCNPLARSEDYNQISVRKAKEIPAPPDAAGSEGPSEAASVVGTVVGFFVGRGWWWIAGHGWVDACLLGVIFSRCEQKKFTGLYIVKDSGMVCRI